MSSIRDKIQYRIEMDSPLPGNMVCDAVLQVTAHESIDYRKLPRDIETGELDAVAEAHLKNSAAERIRKAVMGDVEDSLEHATDEFLHWCEDNYRIPCFDDYVQQKFLEVMKPVKKLTR